MGKFVKYVGKYPRIRYKNKIFEKDIPQLIDDELYAFISSKYHLGSKFILIEEDKTAEKKKATKSREEVLKAVLNEPVFKSFNKKEGIDDESIDSNL